MSCRAAQEQSTDGRAIAGESRYWAEGEQLVQRHGALEDVAPGQIEGPLQVQRSQHLAGDHRTLEIRRVLVEQVEAAIGEALAQVVPTGAVELVRRVLE